MFAPQSRWVRLSALVLGLCLQLGAAQTFAAGAAPAAKAKGKGKKAPQGAKNALLSNALNEKGPQVTQCAADFGLDKGAKKVDISVRVTIRSTGEVVDTQINVTAEGGDNAKIKDCVEKLVKTAKFPKVPTPLATSERSWSVASQ